LVQSERITVCNIFPNVQQIKTSIQFPTFIKSTTLSYKQCTNLTDTIVASTNVTLINNSNSIVYNGTYQTLGNNLDFTFVYPIMDTNGNMKYAMSGPGGNNALKTGQSRYSIGHYAAGIGDVDIYFRTSTSEDKINTQALSSGKFITYDYNITSQIPFTAIFTNAGTKDPIASFKVLANGEQSNHVIALVGIFQSQAYPIQVFSTSSNAGNKMVPNIMVMIVLMMIGMKVSF
jgi:hypothetical protein